jgi:hypothetical protein
MKGKYRKRKEKKKARFFCTPFLTNNLSTGNAGLFSNDGLSKKNWDRPLSIFKKNNNYSPQLYFLTRFWRIINFITRQKRVFKYTFGN